MKNNFVHHSSNTFLAIAMFVPTLVHAGFVPDTETKISTDVIQKPSMFKFGFERTKLSTSETMGMLGTTYLIEVIPGLHFGPAAYGALTGQRGGFFTGGAEVAWHQNLNQSFALHSGVYLGGGGGSSALVGGGLMVRPHLDLLWKLGGYSAGISASHISFPNGVISSNQLGFVFSADSKFAYVSPDLAGQRMSVNGRQGVGFDRVLITAGKYRPRQGTTNLSGISTTNSIGYAGMRIERFLSPSMYWGLEAAGAASGGAAGYAEFLGTMGVEAPIWDNAFTIGTRVALGMGGGGNVSVGGGELNKLGIYATANLTPSIHLSLEGGYARAPNGNFSADYGSANFTWDLDHPGASGRNVPIVRNEWVIGSEHYFSAAHKDGSKYDLDAVVVKLNRYLSDTIYLTGQAHSAYSGNSGGYSVGLFGGGYQTRKFANRLSAGAEILIGAAGGGSVDTSGGAIVQPMAYINLNVTKLIGIKLSAGHVKSLKGALNSNVADLSANFTFGTSTR